MQFQMELHCLLKKIKNFMDDTEAARNYWSQHLCHKQSLLKYLQGGKT